MYEETYSHLSPGKLAQVEAKAHELSRQGPYTGKGTIHSPRGEGRLYQTSRGNVEIYRDSIHLSARESLAQCIKDLGLAEMQSDSDKQSINREAA